MAKSKSRRLSALPLKSSNGHIASDSYSRRYPDKVEWVKYKSTAKKH